MTNETHFFQNMSFCSAQFHFQINIFLFMKKENGKHSKYEIHSMCMDTLEVSVFDA